MSTNKEEVQGLMQNGEEQDVPLPEFPQQQPPGYGYPTGYQPLSATTQNTSSNTTVVMNQPAPQQFSVTYAGQRPPNQFVLSFLALCLCAWCWPALVFAILGIVYSIQVDNQWTNKDYEGARQHSIKAQRWSVVALVLGGVGFVLFVISIVLQLAGLAAATSTSKE